MTICELATLDAAPQKHLSLSLSFTQLLATLVTFLSRFHGHLGRAEADVCQLPPERPLPPGGEREGGETYAALSAKASESHLRGRLPLHGLAREHRQGR